MIAELRPHVIGIRVEAADRGVEEAIVIRDVADRLHLRLEVVAGIRLVPLVERERALPAGVAEVTVDGDRTSGAMDGQRRIVGRERGNGSNGSECQSDEGAAHQRVRRRPRPEVSAISHHAAKYEGIRNMFHEVLNHLTHHGHE
jgi:hypothetical protein